MIKTLSAASLMAAALAVGSVNAATVSLNVVNGGFETDANGTAGATGWTIGTNHFWTTNGTFLGGANGGLDPDTGANGTTNYLSPNRVAGGAGSNPVSSFASQNVDMSGYALDIDAGGVTLDVGFWYSNSKNADERTTVSVEFFDASSGSLGSASTGELAQSPAPEGSWLESSFADVLVPTLARSVTITLNQRRLGGSATNSGLDEVSASLNLVPEPSSLALLGLGGLLIGRRRRA